MARMQRAAMTKGDCVLHDGVFFQRQPIWPASGCTLRRRQGKGSAKGVSGRGLPGERQKKRPRAV